MNELITMAAKNMSYSEAAITAVFGYLVVFCGLAILMTILYITGGIFKSKDAKAKAAAAAKQPTEKIAETAPVQKPLAPGSAGSIKLFDVSG